MPVESSRAVFLSYASQDAEAARRICEALRGGGVEVWFDADGGLEHGDEWDSRYTRSFELAVSAGSRPRACRGGVLSSELAWPATRRIVT